MVGPPRFGPPKSKRSYRTVPLADAVVGALARHVDEHGVNAEGLLLHGPDGAAVGRQRFGEAWRKVRAAAGLPAVRFHDTRHTYASVLLSGGVSVAAAAEYLGHSPAELLRTYAHLVPQDYDRARATVQAAFERDARVTVVSRAPGPDRRTSPDWAYSASAFMASIISSLRLAGTS